MTSQTFIDQQALPVTQSSSPPRSPRSLVLSCRCSRGTKDTRTGAAERQQKQPEAVGLRSGYSDEYTAQMFTKGSSPTAWAILTLPLLPGR